MNKKILRIIVPVLFIFLSFLLTKKIIALAASYTINEGYYLIETKKTNGFYINVASPDNGANVQIGTAKQVFYLSKDGSGYYRIEYAGTSGRSAEYLDVASNGDTQNANIAIWGPTTADGQRWEIVSIGSGYYTIYRKNTKISGTIDIAGGQAIAGKNIQLYPKNNGDNQAWRFVTPTFTNTLTYNANGGTGAPSSQSQTVTYPNTASNFTISSTIPTKTGYKFDGWYTSATGGTKVGSSLTLGNNNMSSNQSQTLYAHWSHAHHFTYSSDGTNVVATCSNDYGDCTIEGDEKKVELILEPTNPYYSGEGVTLSWKVNHSINFVLNGSASWKTVFGATSVPSIYYEGTGETIYERTTHKPTAVGTYNASFSAGGLTVSVDFDILNLCTVTFDTNGGINTMDSIDVPLGDFTIPPCTLKPALGKEFNGWSYSKGGNRISGTTITLTGDTTLHARWIDHIHYFTTTTIGEKMTISSCRCGEYIIRYK